MAGGRRSAHRYQAYFCEENAWHLCQHPALGDAPWVMFISNPRRQCLLLAQRAGPSPWGQVVWDYHVVVLDGLDRPGVQCWDLDTHLPCPVDARRWLARTFAWIGQADPALEPMFRVIPRAVFLDQFASDRRHMRAEGGGWMAPPPRWPCIGQGHRLDMFIDMGPDGPGAVLDLDGLRRRLPTPSPRGL